MLRYAVMWPFPLPRRSKSHGGFRPSSKCVHAPQTERGTARDRHSCSAGLVATRPAHVGGLRRTAHTTASLLHLCYPILYNAMLCCTIIYCTGRILSLVGYIVLYGAALYPAILPLPTAPQVMQRRRSLYNFANTLGRLPTKTRMLSGSGSLGQYL